jgi:hypothetical protein
LFLRSDCLGVEVTAPQTLVPDLTTSPPHLLSHKNTHTHTHTHTQTQLEAAREIPAGAHLYDLQNTFPYFYQPRGVEDVAAALKAAMADAGKKGGKAASAAAEETPPRPGARRVVCWETRAVLHAGPAGADHPANRKVVASVRLADLAEQAGLSLDAARHVALVAGPRYSPATGLLRLTAEAAPAREGNAAAIERVLAELVAEGKRVYPS